MEEKVRKKIFVFAIVFSIIFSTNSYAKQFGVKFGLIFSSIKGDLEFDKGKLGYNIGMIKYFSLMGNFDLHVEVLYTTKGAIISQVRTDETGNELGMFETVFHYNYLEIPILAKYNLPVYNSNRIGLFVGPQISFLTGAFWRIEENEDLMIKDTKVNIRNETNEVDYGIVAGLEYPFKVSQYSFFIDARYSLSLNALRASALDGWDGWDWAHHQLFSAGLGMAF